MPSELNIKEMIGQRILASRKAKGLTQKALANLTDDLKQSRINNWERGIRTPGPEEIKQLAQALEVSAAFLMCLTDENQHRNIKNPSQLIALLDHAQACDAKFHIDAIRKGAQIDNVVIISVSTVLLPELSADAFALKMSDDSMTPEFRANDVLIIDSTVSPNPGDYVAVKIGKQLEIIICQYKKLSFTLPQFELLTFNDNWPNIKVDDGVEVDIVGVVVQNLRGYM